MTGHTPWSEIKHKSSPEQREAARVALQAFLELDKAVRDITALRSSFRDEPWWPELESLSRKLGIHA